MSAADETWVWDGFDDDVRAALACIDWEAPPPRVYATDEYKAKWLAESRARGFFREMAPVPGNRHERRANAARGRRR